MSERRLPSLDLVRGIAAFAVAVPHFFVLGELAADRWEIVSVLAVEVFFVLSGYVLAAQIIDCVRGRAWESVQVFLVRRWMRTIPPYLFALGVMSVTAGDVSGADFARYCFYVQNLFFQANTHDYYSVAWSLSVEEWFYVTFPLLTFVVLRRRKRAGLRECVYVALGFVAAIGLARALHGGSAHWGEDVRRVVAFRVDSIAYGFLLYACTARFLPLRTLAWRRWLPIALLLCASSAALAVFGVAAIAFEQSRRAEQLFPYYAAAFGCATVFLFYTLAPLVERVQLLAALSSYLGKISYSVYLFHILIGQIVASTLGQHALWLRMSVYLVAVVAFCSVFYACFERPILSARPRYRARLDVPEDRGALQVGV